MAAAIVLAAGQSLRMGASGEKMWMRVAGKAVWHWSVERLDAHPLITTGVVVVRAKDQDDMQR
ncbi:MAG: NTP transferase domain-containing protein, partial [Firmicutes bacterium]|nr:NTP transferase domain-containing protein [Bacillota bacterium]